MRDKRKSSKAPKSSLRIVTALPSFHFIVRFELPLLPPSFLLAPFSLGVVWWWYRKAVLLLPSPSPSLSSTCCFCSLSR